MCESKNLAQVSRSGKRIRKQSTQLMGWVGTVASLVALVSNTGCSLNFGRNCRCCCHTTCARPNQVTDQYSSYQAFRNQAPRTVAETVVTPKLTPQPQLRFENVKFETPKPKMAPIVPITTSESIGDSPLDDAIWSNLQPEQIDDLVDELFEHSQRKATGFSDLPVGEAIESNSPLKSVVEELSNEADESPEPPIAEPVKSDTREEELHQPNLSMVAEEPAAIVAQVPAESVARPFSIVRLPASDENKLVVNGQALRRSVSDQSMFELERIPKLQAFPVDKRDQRLHGVPVSNDPVTNPRSNLSFLPDSNSSMLVLPGGGPRSMTPAIQLEAMDFRGFRPLPPVEEPSTESQSTLPRIREVLR